jgi:DNA-binding IclR family transcriptional regulator
MAGLERSSRTGLFAQRSRPNNCENGQEMSRNNIETKDNEARSPAKDRLHVESVARALRILEAFSAAPRALSLSQLAESAGVDKSAAQRLSHTLAQAGYLEKTPAGLKPGRKWLDRTYDYLRSDHLIASAHPILTELRRVTEERVALSLFDDLSMLYAIRIESKRDTYYNHLIGRRVPVYCTSGGRAVLAHLPEPQVLDILSRSNRAKLTPKTTTEIGAILAEVARVRQTGYSLGVEEILIGELAVAVAVMDGKGRPVGAVTLAGSLSEWEPGEFVRRFAPDVVAAAASLSFAEQ